MAKQDDWIRITLRLPGDLHERLVEAAASSSMNAEIVERLSDSFVRRISKNAAASLIEQIRNIVLGSNIHDLLDDDVGQALMDYTVKNGLTDEAAIMKLLRQALKANGYMTESEAH